MAISGVNTCNLTHLLTDVLCGLSRCRVQLSATPWTAARQAPLSMGILQARALEWVAVLSFRAMPETWVQSLGWEDSLDLAER